MMKLKSLFFIVASALLFWSCYADKLPSTTAPSSLTDSAAANSDAGVVPGVENESGSGGTLSDPDSRPNEKDAQNQTDEKDAGATDDVEPVDTAVVEAAVVEAAATDDAGEVDANEKEEPTEEFGLSCNGDLCPSVTSPAMQCCTVRKDVEERRAQEAYLCGITRSETEGCIELEQMGALDDSCPSFQPSGVLVEEPGCCTIEGRCGTFDVAEGIGCHENESIDQACGEESVDETQSCEPTGIYAVRAEVDLSWGGYSGPLFDITDDSRGLATIDLKITIDSIESDNSFVASVEPCNVVLPPISNSIICEAYLPTFPHEIWDGGTVPPIPVEGEFSCLHPGCLVSIGPGTGSIGIELEDDDSAWPTADEATTVTCPAGWGEDCYPDHDGDGYPGITVTTGSGEAPGSEEKCASGYTMRATPLSANISVIIDTVYRTDRHHLGVRLRLGASGRLNDNCEATDVAGMAEFVQSRAIGCRIEPGTHDLFAWPAGQNDLCSEAQLQFLNEALPVYDILRLGDVPDESRDLPADKRNPSDGPRFQLIRLGALDEDLSCPQVRDAF